MNNCIDRIIFSGTKFLSAICLVFVNCKGFALPDDQNKQIEVVASSSEIRLGEGLYIHRGTDTEPAHITQGSMEIFGTEIRIEQPDGVLTRVTATGKPARFQQQPDVDQAVIHASGQTLDYDNSKRTLNIDGDAKFSQDGSTITGSHIDYNIDTRNANAQGSDAGKVQVVIPPTTPADAP